MHPHLLLTVEECERLTNVPGKITAIIATSEAPIECLLWSLLSLLVRSTPKMILEHVIVVINGPDRRTGDPTLQDQKQEFLERLRDLKWGESDMPLTITRVWSHIGHAQALETAIPWVHTEAYLVMHDDAIVLSPDWEREAQSFLNDPQAMLASLPPLRYGTLASAKIRETEAMIGFPHMNTVFTLCRKSHMQQCGARWVGYHIPIDYRFPDAESHRVLLEHHRRVGNIQHEHLLPTPDRSYSLISMDIGTWIHYAATMSGLKTPTFSPELVHHFVAASWGNGPNVVRKGSPHVTDLETDLEEFPEFNDLYRDYHTQQEPQHAHPV